MILERVRMSFDRGVAQNKAEDVGLGTTPTETISGGKIRGLGTHFTSPEAEAIAVRLGLEEGRVNREIARRFMRSPIPGLYVVSRKGEMQQAIDEINPDPGVNAVIATYILEAGDNNQEELAEWVETVKNQLKLAPLGRAKNASGEGLDIIKKLADCPVLSEDSRNEIKGLVAQAEFGKIDRPEFKRRIAEMKIDMNMPVVAIPGAAPVVSAPAPVSVPFRVIMPGRAPILPGLREED